MKLTLISLGLMSLVVQIFCQESVSLTEVVGTSDEPASTTIAQAHPVHEPSTEDKKLSKRSYGLGSWGWPEHGYGGLWPGWGGWGHGGYGSHGGGWYGDWYGGHGWPWWYSSHGGGWHGSW